MGPGRRRYMLVGVITAVAVFTLALGAAVGVEIVRKPGDPGEVKPRPTMTEDQRAERFQPGQPWDGEGPQFRSGSQPPQGITQTEAEAFTDYPVFWLGESFGGFNLQSIVRNKYDPPAGIPDHEAMDTLGFAYGDCVIPDGASACPVPLVVMTEPICMAQPQWIVEGAKAGDPETVRSGARLQRFEDGHIEIWSGQVSITVHSPGNPGLTEEIIQGLRGMNRINATQRAGTPLAAPEFDNCEPPTIAPRQGNPFDADAEHP